MIFSIDNEDYNIIINRKNNKNTYLKIDDELNIVINTNYFTTKRKLKEIMNENYDSIYKMLEKKKKEVNSKKEFKMLGKQYNIIFDNKDKNVMIFENNIITPNQKKLDKWYKDTMKSKFLERLEYNYNKFDENIPFPSLKIREMKTRWGVCNIKTKTITLNSLLFRENIEKIDYVIIHELSHLIHFNHSKSFWNLVSKYCSNYKEIRKSLKEY